MLTGPLLPNKNLNKNPTTIGLNIAGKNHPALMKFLPGILLFNNTASGIAISDWKNVIPNAYQIEFSKAVLITDVSNTLM